MTRIKERINTFLRANKKRIVLFIPIPFAIIYIVSNYTTPLYIVGSQALLKANTSVKTFSDSQENGQSEVIIQDTSNDNLCFKYILKKGVLNPYVNIRISKRDSSFFDFSPYQSVKIRIKAQKGLRIPFYMALYDETHTNVENSISFRYALNNLNVGNLYSNITIPFKDLYTPDWWYISNHKSERDFGSFDFSKVQYLYFASCINIETGQEDTVEIEEVSFHVDMLRTYLLSGIFLAIYYLLYVLIKRRNKSVVGKKVGFQYEQVSSRNHYDLEEETVMDYLKVNYAQQDLTIIDVQSAIGIHERKISSIIKKNTELNFKHYLNSLRISEAKKKLTRTKLPISDIAFQVGYANASHFNRVFKSFENCSPNDYRKEHSETSTKGE